jgi:hypothetical protein
MRSREKSWKSAAARRLADLAGNPPTLSRAVEIVAAKHLEGISCPPTHLEALMPRLNISAFEPISGLPFSGELRKDGNYFKVVYSTSLSPGRRRFTIAHELAHAIFETTGPNCPRYGRELERICDMLASEILLPRQVFIERAGSDCSPQKIFKLAGEFQTSLMATALRCYQLFGVSIFQVKDGRLVWGYGAIRNDRHIQDTDDEFRSAISDAMEGKPGERLVFLRRSIYILRWTSVAGLRPGLFVLKPHVV